MICIDCDKTVKKPNREELKEEMCEECLLDFDLLEIHFEHKTDYTWIFAHVAHDVHKLDNFYLPWSRPGYSVT